MGTEEATSGHIIVNGTELGELSKMQLWDRIAYVPQNPILFADTLEYNIVFGEKYPENEIKYVCDMAGLSEFIQRTPQGLSLFIDENAANLSAGQKQSLAIARALIRKPDILILDEATSNMDEMRERTVIQNLLQLEISCVFVTHNSAIVQLMDEIVQVDKPF